MLHTIASSAISFCGNCLIICDTSPSAGTCDMKKVGILVDFAGGYGRSVLHGVMHFAQFAANDWEFAMPPMYRLSRHGRLDPRQLDGVIAMLHDERSAKPFQQARVPIINTARTLS